MVLKLGPLHINEREASLDGRLLPLRPLDVRVLARLARANGHAVPRSDLAESLWGPHTTVDPRAVDTSVVRIRRALDGCGDAIITVRRVGYRLDPDRLS